jgi:hypothetical protein
MELLSTCVSCEVYVFDTCECVWYLWMCVMPVIVSVLMLLPREERCWRSVGQHPCNTWWTCVLYINEHMHTHSHIYAHIHINMYTYMHGHIHTYIHTCMRRHIHKDTHSQINTHNHTPIYIYIYIHTHIYIFIDIYIYIHTHTHNYIHTYLYARMVVWLARDHFQNLSSQSRGWYVWMRCHVGVGMHRCI